MKDKDLLTFKGMPIKVKVKKCVYSHRYEMDSEDYVDWGTFQIDGHSGRGEFYFHLKNKPHVAPNLWPCEVEIVLDSVSLEKIRRNKVKRYLRSLSKERAE